MKKTIINAFYVAVILLLSNVSAIPQETVSMLDTTTMLPVGVTTGNLKIDRIIEEAAYEHDIDPVLLVAQIHQESSNNTKAVSNKGAKGLMQLMPATARRWGVKNVFDPKQNIFAGAKYLRWLLNLFKGDTKLALAGYNAGEGSVKKYGNQIPPYKETQKYVRRIMANYEFLSQK